MIVHFKAAGGITGVALRGGIKAWHQGSGIKGEARGSHRQECAEVVALERASMGAVGWGVSLTRQRLGHP